jgi:hypothetical protein
MLVAFLCPRPGGCTWRCLNAARSRSADRIHPRAMLGIVIGAMPEFAVSSITELAASARLSFAYRLHSNVYSYPSASPTELALAKDSTEPSNSMPCWALHACRIALQRGNRRSFIRNEEERNKNKGSNIHCLIVQLLERL